MGQLNLIIETMDEYRLVAKELGERLTPYLLRPKNMDVIRIDVIGNYEKIRAAFVQSIASAMLFNNPAPAPADPVEVNAYAHETRTAAGRGRQVIIVDSQGLDYSLRKRDIPARTSPGALIVQHPDFDKRLDAANAAKIDVSTHVSVKIQSYAKDVHGLSLDIHLPDFPMERFKQSLIKRGVLTPPKRTLNHRFSDSKLAR